MADVERRPAIVSSVTASDGFRSSAVLAAEVRCQRCTGWIAVECPHGCGVRLVDVSAREERELFERLRVEQEQRREERRAWREARGA